MAWPYGGEVAAIQGGYVRASQPFSHRDHRSIHGTQREIRVSVHELGHPSKIGPRESDELEFTVSKGLQELGLGRGTDPGLEEIADLREHGTRHHHRTAMFLQQVKTPRVIGV